MKPEDTVRFGMRALFGYPARTLLVLLAMAMGVASVILLTALGEGARRYVAQEFTSLGTHLLFVLPGRSETVGGPPPLLASTPRDLTLEDAMALTRISSVERVAPVSVGAAPVSWRERHREVTLLGSTAALFEIRQLAMSQGSFLPAGDPFRGEGIAVLGHKVKRELFGNRNALGEWIRIQDRRFRVIGVMTPKGQSLGMDMSDTAVIPVASALSLFDTESLFRIILQAKSRQTVDRVKDSVIKVIRERHEGEDDITVITQDAILSTFDRILTTMTLTVTGIAAVSLVVAGILIMNVMLISVSQRRTEIGLLKALGARSAQILRPFLTEASVLSMAGAGIGVAIGYAGAWVLAGMFPAFPLQVPLWSLAAAVLTALVNGLIFGVLPARRASYLDPVQALAKR
ncbi:MAG: ABC transporter permease [Deltaproteobacteria bacterium]|nr:ABC transporter permease [Deltaproteobacteria bacterium]